MELGFSFWIALILIAIMMGVLQGTCAYLILAERKISAWAQDRLGPNRVGPWGLLQPIADGIKFLLKEEIIPNHVDRLFYMVGPAVAVSTALLAFAVVPFGPTTPPPVLEDRRTDEMIEKSRQPLAAEERELLESNRDFREQSRGRIWPQTASEEAYVLAADRAYANANKEKGVKGYEDQLRDYNAPYEQKITDYNLSTLEHIQYVIAPHVDIGIVFNFAVGSLAVYGIVLGGWSSNNKYSMLGALRSSAQLISYEIPLGLSVLGVMAVTGSLNLETILDYQVKHGWNILFQPLAALLFATSVFAECNRLPFDLPEAEQELVGGYHTEYSAMKFALFFLGEYTHMITTSFLVVILFFGGWHFPGVDSIPGVGGVIVKLIVIAVKMTLFIIFYMLIRWTLPRFRFDQLMGLTWKVLLPLALINLICVIVVKQYNQSEWLLLPLSIAMLLAIAGLALYMPRQRSRAPVRFTGHVASGPPALVHDDAID
ncbi:MAG TPA: complex I subunit 1 family protein [Gemmataceae bacterium]|nr:complex I subunit 1 family protein [Gemmataceae bacterium]